MQKTESLKTWRRTFLQLALFSSLLLLIVLAGFQWIWVAGGSTTNIMLQVGLQRIRTQAIAKNVLILSYRTDEQERAQAISDLQNILPAFERAQVGLQSGDKALQLPRAPSEVQQLLFAAQPDYVAIDGALRQIVARTALPLDPIQRDIILLHISNYSATMNQVHLTWQARIDEAFYVLFWWEIGLTGVVIGLLIVAYLLPVRQLFAELEKRTLADLESKQVTKEEENSNE